MLINNAGLKENPQTGQVTIKCSEFFLLEFITLVNIIVDLNFLVKKLYACNIMIITSFTLHPVGPVIISVFIILKKEFELLSLR